MLPEGNRHPPIDGSGGLFTQNFIGAELSKLLGAGNGGEGGRGGDIGCNNVGHQQNYINGPYIAGNQINYNASWLKGDLFSSFAIFV